MLCEHVHEPRRESVGLSFEGFARTLLTEVCVECGEAAKCSSLNVGVVKLHDVNLSSADVLIPPYQGACLAAILRRN